MCDYIIATRLGGKAKLASKLETDQHTAVDVLPVNYERQIKQYNVLTMVRLIYCDGKQVGFIIFVILNADVYFFR